jgi:hypothetical protein
MKKIPVECQAKKTAERGKVMKTPAEGRAKETTEGQVKKTPA